MFDSTYLEHVQHVQHVQGIVCVFGSLFEGFELPPTAPGAHCNTIGLV